MEPATTSCEMKGFLSFLVMWLLSRKKMTGAEISLELEKRKGSKPSPGTIYPVLKYLKSKGVIDDKDKKYYLTSKGKKELETQLTAFFKTFCDINEMKSCCRKL